MHSEDRRTVKSHAKSRYDMQRICMTHMASPSHVLAAGCQRCALLTIPLAGRIVEQGTHDSLLAEGKIYAMLVRRQAGGGAEQAPLSDSNKSAAAGLQTQNAADSEVCA